MTRPRTHPDHERERLERLGLRDELVEVLARPAANARRRLTRDTRAERRRQLDRLARPNRHAPARPRAA